MNSIVREPAVAGSFYPAAADALRDVVDTLLDPADPAAAPARLLLVPHAGYVYSGAIAAEGYRRVRVPDLVVVLAPNHHGIGAPLAMPRAGRWRTPLGTLAIDEAASEAIAAREPGLADDWRAHARDHALEVHLPFLQRLAARQGRPMPSIVTIACGTQDPGRLRACGLAVAEGLRDAGRSGIEDALIIVSSDMSHYIPAKEARALDLPALELACALDAERLHALVHGRGISMCGIAPAVAGLVAARELGAREGELLRYGHSGEVTGDDRSVVAYATLLVRG